MSLCSITPPTHRRCTFRNYSDTDTADTTRRVEVPFFNGIIMLRSPKKVIAILTNECCGYFNDWSRYGVMLADRVRERERKGIRKISEE